MKYVILFREKDYEMWTYQKLEGKKKLNYNNFNFRNRIRSLFYNIVDNVIASKPAEKWERMREGGGKGERERKRERERENEIWEGEINPVERTKISKYIFLYKLKLPEL